ncbi:MAG: hypothetical protein ABL927_07005 [Bdellovibrionales bacterium]
MDALHIIAGFSDIKSELRTKTRLSTTLDQLELWFTFDNNVLYIHDYDDHEKCIPLVIFASTNRSLTYLLPDHGYGFNLVKYICENNSYDEILEPIKGLYASHGFIPFRRK